MTARSFLDFIYHLLCGKGYLFENLFSAGDNELLKSIKASDPTSIRCEVVDDFILKFGLRIKSPELENFKDEVKKNFKVKNIRSYEPFLQLFYILQYSDRYDIVATFKDVFLNKKLIDFIKIHYLHSMSSYDYTKDDENELKEFYKKVITSAIHKFMNLNIFNLKNDEFFIKKYNDFYFILNSRLRIDLSRIKKTKNKSFSSFNIYLKLDDDELPEFPTSINFITLLEKINKGYRPNKSDKGTVIILEELVEKIKTAAVNRNKLTLLNFSNNKKWEILKEGEDLEVEEVS
jgi:DNA phosphorothioation-dependent restriction protein DptF